MRDYRKYEVWQKAHKLTLYIYADFARFLDMALGSCHESEYAILLIKDLRYISEELYTETDSKINEVKAMLIGLLKKIRN